MNMNVLRHDMRLKTTQNDNNADEDFASFNEYQGQGDEGQKLAMEFYQELENRQRTIQSTENNDETYSIRSSDGSKPNKNTIRASVRIQPAGSTGTSSASSSSNSGRFTNQPSKTTSPSPSTFPLFPFFSFPAPAPRATSAGLFSGSGTTVYSSGRSIRAEIEILESTIKNNEAAAKDKQFWEEIYVGSSEQLEEILKLVALALVVASATYVAIEISGVGATVISWDGGSALVDGALDSAAASAHHLMSLMNDANKDDMSNIMVSVGNGEVLLREEAALLMKESSDAAAYVVDAVRSVEELVLS